MKITIVGGGSAGWMSAAMLVHAFPDYSIEVIESPNTPTVGVGESTITGIRQFCNFIGVDEKDFLRHTNGSYKVAIKFKDFDTLGSSAFLYPFGIPSMQGTLMGLQDWLIKKYAHPETELSDFAESYFPTALMVKHNTFFKNPNYSVLDSYDSNIGIAYHFDAAKFAEWLKVHYALPKGVIHKLATVSDIHTDGENITFLKLDSEEVITADLFIDCTGFSSKLLSGALKENFLDYSDMLPNNKAWATQLPYLNKEVELTNVTSCTAISNGWVWDIPLWSRLGTGYVYSDKYISKEGALKEFKEYLKSSNMLVPRSDFDLESLSFKDISFRVGIHERTWVGNVVAIGLSAGFIEPLESSGLFTVHQFLFELVRALSRGTPSKWDKETYNIANFRLFNEFAEFVALHYALTKRTDTQYWKDIFNKDFMFFSKESPSFFSAIVDSKTRTGITPSKGGYSWILVGMGYLMLDNITASLGEMEHPSTYDIYYKKQIEYLTDRRVYWENVISKQTSLYEYLTTYIYTE
jgi:tryptophan halogenase